MKKNLIPVVLYRWGKISFLSAVLALCSLNLRAQKALLPQIDSLFTALQADQRFNGNVLIAENGKPVFEKSYGYENFDTRQPLTHASVFELASCSKQFTAFAIALLQHQKKLSYNDDITRFLPELSAYKGITVGNLVHHTSGLPDYMALFDSLWDKSKIASNADLVKLLAQHHPAVLFAPGAKFEYSNTGYALLASIIEKASGKSYGAYLQQYIFKPLKMEHSLVYNRRYRPQKIAHYAYDFIYQPEQEKYVLIDSIPEMNMVYWLDGISGDGTVNTTARDLLLWDQALYTDKLLPSAERAVLFTPGKLKDGTATDYAFGWMIQEHPEAGKLALHTGGWGGYCTFIERELDRNKTVIILQNIDKGAIPGKSVRSLLYGKPLAPAAVRKEIAVDEKVLDQYTGEYELEPGFSLVVTQEGNQLYTQATGQSKVKVYPESERKFFLKVIDAQLEFVKDDSGKVTHAVLYQGGAAMNAKKIK
ncbi:serine hydrolase [Taibaiella koreensis]|uniref:serine hydrolase n=1 Tax=Taibaiella koreensis TaxID=1268548 RepID=UPI000E59F05A|nr:serine hydrolase [Taibaiella koreensis]